MNKAVETKNIFEIIRLIDEEGWNLKSPNASEILREAFYSLDNYSRDNCLPISVVIKMVQTGKQTDLLNSCFFVSTLIPEGCRSSDPEYNPNNCNSIKMMQWLFDNNWVISEEEKDTILADIWRHPHPAMLKILLQRKEDGKYWLDYRSNDFDFEEMREIFEDYPPGLEMIQIFKDNPPTE